MISEQDAINIIRFRLSKNRFKHSMQVAQIAREMAEHYGVCAEKAYITGLLHDYAKGISGEELISIAEENNLIEDQIERQVPDLLHAPVGACLLKKELGIEDEELLRAVSLHTLGGIEMNDLDKIIYLADMIEPGRDFPGIERLKCVAWRNLDEGMLFGLESTIKYCIYRRRLLHPRTVAVRNHFLKVLDKGERLKPLS